MGDTFNQNHKGSGDNVVNFGKQPFKLTDEIKAYWLTQTKGSPRFGVGPLGGNPRSIELARELCEYLIAGGSNAGHAGRIGQLVGSYGPIVVGQSRIFGEPDMVVSLLVNADG